MKYKHFMNERLGIVDELPAIADTILKRFETENEFIIDINIAGKDVKLKCVFDDSKKAKKKSVAHLNPDKKMSILNTTVLDKGSIIHELKHLHRSVSRNFKRSKHDFISGINSYISKKHKHILKDESQLLYYIIYYTNPNEFESFYNQFYYDIKGEFDKKEYSNEEKREYIDEFLDDKIMYLVYKTMYLKNRALGGKFSIETSFKTKTVANDFLQKLIKISKELEKTQSDENHSDDVIGYQLAKEISGYSSIISRIKLIFSKYIKDGEIDQKSLNYINNIINKRVVSNMKKFHRLYTLLIEKTED